MNFRVLLDAPTKPVRRIQIAKLGTFHDNRYGEFDITADNVANWQRNLSKLPGGEALIDFEHRSERKPRDSKAAGWISGIALDGTKVMADARWTPDGEAAIRDETYRFLSPTFGPALGADNEMLDDALPSVGLTNKPVLGMPSLMLASEERVSEALDEDPALRFHTRALEGDYGEHTRALVTLDVSQAEREQATTAAHSLPDGSYPINSAKQLHSAAVLAASKHGDWKAAQALIRRRAGELGVDAGTLPGMAAKTADSRRASMDHANLLKTLDLDGSADDAAITEALKSLKASADKAKKLEQDLGKKPRKTLESQADEAGLVLLDRPTVKQLKLDAAAGAQALRELHDSKFNTAFELALNDPQGARVEPAERDSLKHFYTLDADATIKMIEARNPVVGRASVPPPGTPPTFQLDADGQVDPAAAAAAGVHPGSVVLDQKIRAHITSQNLPNSDASYTRVLDQVMQGSLTL